VGQRKRRPLIAGNWKMHMNHLEAIEVVQKLSYNLDSTDYDAVEVVLCPPFTALRSVQTVIDADKLKFGLGAQNCHWQDKGAYTGEISPPMLKKLDVSYVIVGHSERRQYFGETDEVVAKKARAVRDHEMIPIVCVGESLEEKDSGLTHEVVERQTSIALAKFGPEDAGSLVIAYEPLWAIGTGRNASAEEAGEVVVKIKEIARKSLGTESQKLRVLYGGSVKAGNIAGFVSHPAIDGALVGGASLDPDEFGRIVRYSRPPA
jgi:triosephosphate isomerase